MRKGLFFTLLGVTVMLCALLAVDAYRMTRLAYFVHTLPSRLESQGWHLSWQVEKQHWRPWGSRITLSSPVLDDGNGHGWAGGAVSFGTSPFHPFTIPLILSGPQIVRLDASATLTTGDGSGQFNPRRNALSLRFPLITAAGLTGQPIESLMLHEVTLRLVAGAPSDASAPAWGLELHARRALPQFRSAQTEGWQGTDRLAALMALMPPPSELHLVLAALRHANASKTGVESYERYLIQEAAFTLGPLVCVTRGTVDGAGDGNLWAHLSGLQGFARYWITHTPDILRIMPDEAPLLRYLNEQSARIPDHIDLPVPIGRDDILLQNHIFEIIKGHSR